MADYPGRAGTATMVPAALHDPVGRHDIRQFHERNNLILGYKPPCLANILS